MIPTTKISHTILEFGKSIILNLPEDHSKEDLEATMEIIITAWNAVAMDTWDNDSTFEKSLLDTLNDMPLETKIIIKRLIQRKKNKFSNDPRAVGKHWVTEGNSGFVFGCEARLSIENLKTDHSIH